MEESVKQTNAISFPVVIHQTDSAYFLRIGNDNYSPEDFSIIVEEGKLIIAAKEHPKRRARFKAEHSFLHTVKGKQVTPPPSRTKKGSLLRNALISIKSFFL